MKKTKVMCPVCRASFEISENEHVVSNAVVIGKDSGLGNVFLKLEDDRKMQLERKGIDTSKYFSISSPKGDDVLMRWGDDGVPQKVDDNDPVIIAIRKAGNVPNRRLFRRWVTRQMFGALIYKSWRRGCEGFTAWMQDKGYYYTWKQTIEEFRVQSILSSKDEENFAMRNRWFYKEVPLAMCNDYIRQLTDHVDDARTRKCKGVPYKRIGGKNVFVKDIQSKVFRPLEKARDSVMRSSTPIELYIAIRDFCLSMPSAHFRFEQCPAWQDAYKGAGAYFTLRNLIMFHNVKYVGCSDYSSSLKELDRYAEDGCRGYEMLGALKETLRRNDFDIEAKIAEWRK